MVNFDASEPVVILGFGQMGQVLANFLSIPLASGMERDAVGWPYVAFDLDLSVVKASKKLGFPVLYGDGSSPEVLQSAGISSPKAVMVMYTGRQRTIKAVQRIRLSFPAIPIYARAQDMAHLLELKKAGATDAILENAETSLQLGSKLMKGLGVMSDDVTFLSQLVRDSMELQAQEALNKTDERDLDVLKPLKVRVADVGAQASTQSGREKELKVKQVAKSSFSYERTDPSADNIVLQQSRVQEAEGLSFHEKDSKDYFRVNSEVDDMPEGH